ncbi:MAG: GPR endopeptidase [Clostridia bacterium]|nr:GPR endopeptidase [Clostridia bacterium]
MSEYKIRTDLALEARELNQGDAGHIDGVTYDKQAKNDCIIHIMEVTSSSGAATIGKPIGKYCTIELSGIVDRQSENFESTAKTIADQLTQLIPARSDIETVLVVGLGNHEITPDAVGQLAADSVLVTKHLKENMPAEFSAFSPVCVIRPGVLGTSGIESSQYVKTICDYIKPCCVIAIDALAARETNRLCRTVQISDTGIVPGSGVGNSRAALNQETLNVPVIAVGVPTVVDISSILVDAGASVKHGNLPDESFFVTPRTIDAEVRAAGKLIGYSVDLALHKDLTVADIGLLIG